MVAILPPNGHIGEAIKNHFECACEDRPFVVVISLDSKNCTGAPLTNVLPSAWYAESVTSNNLPQASLVAMLSAPPWNALVDVLRAYSIAASAESLSSVLGLGLEQEIRALRAKRSVAQQRIAKLQQRPNQATPGEQAAELRSRIQRQFADFERGASDRFQALITPQVGTVAKRLDENLAGLGGLESEKRAKSTSYRIPEQFETSYTNTVRDALTKQVQSDLLAMQDLFRILQGEIERQMVSLGGPPLTLCFRLIDEDRVTRLLQSTIVFQRSYHSELIRHGFFEYAMMARRYLMILFMIISAFGLSFLRGYREFMIPASILLLSIGGMMVFRSVNRERGEVMEKELEKARESLRAESKRIFSDVQRAWSGLISQHLTDQSQVAISQIEASIRSAQAQRGNDLGEEKLRLQRQLQTLENAERKLQMASKNKEMVVNAISQIKGELRQLVIGGIRQIQRTAT
jgi:hypothetical protein